MARIPTIKPLVGVIAPLVPRQEKTAEPFYQSAEWRAFAKTVKRQRGNVCEKCSRPSLRLIADHIVERKDGGEDFDPNNIQCLCIGCHNAKTAKARAKRAATQARRLPR